MKLILIVYTIRVNNVGHNENKNGREAFPTILYECKANALLGIGSWHANIDPHEPVIGAGEREDAD